MVVVVAEQLVAVEIVAGGVDEVDVVEQPVERLGLADLSADLDVDAGVLVGAADTSQLLAGLHGDPLVLRTELVVVGIQSFGCRHGA